MKTPEDIKKVLLECDEGYACKRIECPYDDGLCLCNGSRCMMDARKDALAYIQQLEEANQNFVNVINALSEKVPQWISVEERLPESEQCVLICYKSGFISIGYWCEDFVEWDGMTDEEISRPDYWMPLPEPVRDADELPKEG